MRNNFDALRLIGAFLVLVSHQFLIVGGEEPKIEGVSLGLVGVAMFFGISGYLVSASWDRDPCFLRFAARRLLRLWPGLALLVLTVSAFAWLYPWESAKAQMQYPLAASLYLRHLYFHYWDWSFFQSNPVSALDPSLWTIPYEALFYLALGVSSLIFRKHLKWLALVALLASFLLIGRGAWLAGCFLAGMTAFHFKWWPALLIVAAVLTACVGFYGRAGMILIAGLAVFVGSRSWPVLSRAGDRGDFSYGMYLWGWPVQQVVILLMTPETPFLTLTLTSIVYSLALGWLSWHLVEKQALKLKPSKDDKRWELGTSVRSGRRSEAGNREEVGGVGDAAQLVHVAVEGDAGRA